MTPALQAHRAHRVGDVWHVDPKRCEDLVTLTWVSDDGFAAEGSSDRHPTKAPSRVSLARLDLVRLATGPELEASDRARRDALARRLKRS